MSIPVSIPTLPQAGSGGQLNPAGARAEQLVLEALQWDPLQPLALHLHVHIAETGSPIRLGLTAPHEPPMHIYKVYMDLTLNPGVAQGIPSSMCLSCAYHVPILCPSCAYHVPIMCLSCAYHVPIMSLAAYA